MPEQRPNASDKPLLLPPGRTLPYNAEAEIAVLGSILLDPEHALDTTLRKLPDDSSFQSAAHRAMFRAIRRLGEDGAHAIDLVSLAETLDQQGELEEAGGREYLLQVMNSVVSPANVETYVDIVHQNAVLRRLIRTASGVIQRCTAPDGDTASLLDEIEAEVLQLTNMEAGSEATPVGDCVMGAIRHIELLHHNDQEAIGLQTGYEDLDKLLTGLRGGEMLVLAARPSIGKTALALNLACNIAMGKQAAPVGLFSLEMSRELLTLRLLCSEARVNLSHIREGAVSRARWQEILKKGQELKEAPIYIDDSGNLDIVELRAKARRMFRDFGIRAIMVDYLQLMKSSLGANATRENEVARNSMGIKSLAKELEVPVIVLAQLNRQAEQPGQRPKLSHLRESGAIEQDADVVALLHRDREADLINDAGINEMEAELIIAKHRNGPTGVVPLTFFPDFTKFEGRSRFSDDDAP